MARSSYMAKEIPYYILDGEDKFECIASDGQAYIDDEDLRNLLIDILGDKVSHDDIQKILDAASDENMSEKEFDKLVDEFILKNSN